MSLTTANGLAGCLPASLDVALWLFFASTVPILIVVSIQLIRMIVQIVLCLHRLHLLSVSKILCTCCLWNDRRCRHSQKFFDVVLFHNFYVFPGSRGTGCSNHNAERNGLLLARLCNFRSEGESGGKITHLLCPVCPSYRKFCLICHKNRVNCLVIN